MRRCRSHTALELLDLGPGAPLLARARSLASLQNRVRRLLPAPLAAHCTVLNLRDGTLSLAADSPAWAARLRFMAGRLTERLDSREIRRIHVTTRPAAQPRRDRPRMRRAHLSAQAGATLARAARGIRDERLRRALERLAAHAAED